MLLSQVNRIKFHRHALALLEVFVKALHKGLALAEKLARLLGLASFGKLGRT